MFKWYRNLTNADKDMLWIAVAILAALCAVAAQFIVIYG